MTADRFWISRLEVSGPNVAAAGVDFKPGFNVVCGPSDTGKTFMAQCIDFALGAKDPPKDIPEANGFDTVRLSIRTSGGEDVQIVRALRGGDARIADQDGERVVGWRHLAGKSNTLSYFLLNLCDLTGRRVLKNQRGVTRDLSFRDIAHLAIIDEEKVITDRSPFLTGQVISKTVEGSVFRLILTGMDDSAVEGPTDPAITKSRREAKLEVLDDLEARAKAQLEELGITVTPNEAREDLAGVEAVFDEVSKALSVEQKAAGEWDRHRRDVWSNLRRADSRLFTLGELHRRFELLQQQYSSDLLRLEAISEAGLRLEQLVEERCPVCGAAAEHHDPEHRRPEASPRDVAIASRSEGEKIQILLGDLGDTLLDNQLQTRALEELKSGYEGRLREIEEERQSQLQPRLEEVLARFRECQAARDQLRKAVDLFDQLDEFAELRADTSAPGAPRPVPSAGLSIGADRLEKFSREVEAVLQGWNFPGLGRVTFSEADNDVVITGYRRGSHGKGVRAVTHAAFSVALLKYCLAEGLPHPGLAVIDSPLVVYRQPDPDEKGFSPNVKEAFFRALATGSNGAQVVVFENEDPPRDLDTIANIIRFSGTTHGRWGFLPPTA